MCVVVSYLQYETVKLQAASEQEIYVFKKKKKKTQTKNTKSLDICCTLNGLFILNFVSMAGVTKANVSISESPRRFSKLGTLIRRRTADTKNKRDA